MQEIEKYQTAQTLPQWLSVILGLVLLISTSTVAQTVDTAQSNHSAIGQGTLLAGLQWRVAGNRSLGFHSFPWWHPELQAVYFLTDHIGIGGSFRPSGSSENLVDIVMFDLAGQVRIALGPNKRHTYLDLQAGRGLIFGRWKPPLEGNTKHHNNMIAVGLGRNLLLHHRFLPEVELLYEWRKTDGGSWFGSFKVDLGIKYRLRGGSIVKHPDEN